MWWLNIGTFLKHPENVAALAAALTAAAIVVAVVALKKTAVDKLSITDE